MNNNSMISKLKELKKMIKDTTGFGTDNKIEYIMLSAITEIELRKGNVQDLNKLEMKLDEAIHTLTSKTLRL